MKLYTNSDGQKEAPGALLGSRGKPLTQKLTRAATVDALWLVLRISTQIFQYFPELKKGTLHRGGIGVFSFLREPLCALIAPGAYKGQKG